MAAGVALAIVLAILSKVFDLGPTAVLAVVAFLFLYALLVAIVRRLGARIWREMTPPASTPRLATPDGRKAFADVLVMYHGQGVANLQTGPNATWATEEQMADWLERDGQWVGEIVATMRAFGCSHAEIHDVGVLGPPRFLASYAAGATPGQPFRANLDRYQSWVAERLHRIKELIQKYQ